MYKIYLIVGILTITFSVSGASTARESTREMKEEIMSAPGAIEEVEGLVSLAVDLAKEYLERAIEEEQSEKMKRIYLQMSRKFLSTTFRIEESGRGSCRLDWSGDEAMAVVMYVRGTFFGMRNKIYVCTVLLLLDDPVAGAAQTILHELAHIVGIDNECQAEFVRYSIVELNDLEFMASGYDCSLGTSSSQGLYVTTKSI